jgi:hypothetical protein
MELPPGSVLPDAEKKVCKLKKSLYGLKQAGRQWYRKLSKAFDNMKFKKSHVNHAVFYKQDSKGSTIICVSTDDLTIAASSSRRMDETKLLLRSHFEMTDLGELEWMLGIRLTRDRERRTGTLSQTAYIDHILDRFHLSDAKPTTIPLSSGLKLSRDQCPGSTEEQEKMKNVPYREIIGSLMYAAQGTRPDIAFPVTALSQFLQNPGAIHWEEAKRVLRYLKGTRETGIIYGRDTEGVKGFVDSDWGENRDDRHSISGYAFTINGGAVTWSSKKQRVVALSSTEAEYIALTHAAKEAKWLKSFLIEIYDPGTQDHPLHLYCDNMSAMSLAKDSTYHSRTKHIDIRYHFIREAYDAGTIDLTYCPTGDMPADLLTKPLTRAKLEHLIKFIGIARV